MTGVDLRVAMFGLAAAGNVALALVVLRRSSAGAVRRAGAGLAFGVAAFTGSFLAIQFASEPSWLAFWSRMAFVSGAWMFFAVLALGLVFPYRSAFARPRTMGALAAVALLFSAVAATPDAVVTAAERLPTHVRAHYGWAHRPFLLYALACALSAFGLLVAKYRHSSYQQRLRVRYFLFGIALFFTVTLLTNAALPALGVTAFNQVGPLFSLLFVGCTAYAIGRHRLMDIEVIVRRGVVYSTLIAAVSLVSVAVLLLAQSELAGPAGPLVTVLGATLIVFGVGPLRRWLDHATDRVFFGELADPAELVRRVSGRLGGAGAAEESLEGALSEIRAALKSENIRLYVRRGGGEDFVLSFGDPLPADGRLDAADPLVRTLFAPGRELVTREETAAMARQGGAPGAAAVGAALALREAEVALPLHAGGRAAGVLTLGRKRGGTPYRNRELAVAGTLAAQMGIALENRRLLDEVRRGERLAVLGTVAASVAHEIRNPLTSLRAFVETLSEFESDPTYWKRSEKLRRMLVDQTSQMDRLITNLLNLAAPRSAAAGPVALHTLLADLIAMQERSFRSRRIEMSLDAPAPVHAGADAAQVTQVFLNLLINAQQAMPQGGRIVAAVREESDAAGRRWAVGSVSDTGVGIPPERVGRVFEPFYTTRPDGTGLGLATVHRIVTEHGGEMSVESQVGVGTKFTVRLPAAVARREEV